MKPFNDVPGRCLELEITENAIMEDMDSVIRKLQELSSHGITIAIDDFGTGYSSLSYLHKLPISILKIDKSFVTDFHATKNDTQAIVNAILVMTEQLGIKCIVEGVELQEHVDYFKEKGVNHDPGYRSEKKNDTGRIREYSSGFGD